MKERSMEKDREEFEEWARDQKMDMSLHPMHYLFLDSKTYAARQGWKAGVKFGRSTRPDNSELRQAAKGALELLEFLKEEGYFQTIGESAVITSLRAALEGK